VRIIFLYQAASWSADKSFGCLYSVRHLQSIAAKNLHFIAFQARIQGIALKVSFNISWSCWECILIA